MKNNLSLSLSNAKEELTIAILNIQEKNQLPAYLMELVINSTLLDVKGCANRETIKELLKNQEGEEEK